VAARCGPDGLTVKVTLERRKGGTKPVGDKDTLLVLTSDFLATGGEGYDAGKRATASRPLNIVDLDALIDYLKSRPEPITAPTEVRISPVTP